MAVEVTVTNQAYWRDRAPQLAQLLRGAGEGGGPSTFGDPTGKPPDPERLLAVADPGYWSEQGPASWRRSLLSPPEAKARPALAFRVELPAPALVGRSGSR